MECKNHLRNLRSIRWMMPILGAMLILCLPAAIHAQAPAGPISGTPDKSGPRPRIAAKDPTKGGLAGEWQINKSMSDDPRQRMEQANPHSHSGPQIGMGGPGGSGGGGGHHGGPSSGAREERQAHELTDDLTFLTINQKGTSVKVVTDGGRVLAQYAGPASATSQETAKTSESDNKNSSITQWQGDALVTVSQHNGTKITRTLALSRDGTQLYLTTDLEGGHYKQPVSFRLVYDPARPQGDEDQ
jgi:hypothetical protein